MVMLEPTSYSEGIGGMAKLPPAPPIGTKEVLFSKVSWGGRSKFLPIYLE